MTGIFGTSSQAIALASALALKGEEVLLYSADDSDLEELKDREGGSFSTRLDTFFTEAKETGLINFSVNLQALLNCSVIFISGTIVRGETDPKTAMRLLIPNVLTVLRSAASQRKPASELNIVLLNELPYQGYSTLLEAVKNEKIEPGEAYSEEDTTTDEEISHLKEPDESNPEGLNFNLALSPLVLPAGGIREWINYPRQAFIGSYSAELIGRLRELYHKIGVPRKEIIASSPQGIEDAFILKDAYRIIEQVFVDEAGKLTSDTVFYELIKYIKPPKPSFQIDNALVERLEALQALRGDMTFFKDALDDAKKVKDELIDSIVERLEQYYQGSLEGLTIAVAGFYLRPDEPDMRGSQVIALTQKLVEKGAHLHFLTPDGGHNLKWRLNSWKDNITYDRELSKCFKGTSVFLYLGESGVRLNLRRIAKWMNDDPVLYDPFGLLTSFKGHDLFVLL